MDLNDLRAQMDKIDQRLSEDFRQRMKVASEIAKYKQENNLPVFDPEREQAVLNRQLERADTDTRRYMKLLYHTLFDVSRSYQRQFLSRSDALTEEIRQAVARTPRPFPPKMAVACLGEESACGLQACKKLFPSPVITYCKQPEEVLQAVQSGVCAYGVLPVGNGSDGSVAEMYGLLRKYGFFIVRAVRVEQPGKQEGVGGRQMRCLCISKALEIVPGANKMSLAFNVQHQPGALYGVLARFAALGLNLTGLERRPLPGDDTEFICCLDLDASVQDGDVLTLLAELDEDLNALAFLGSYREACGR